MRSRRTLNSVIPKEAGESQTCRRSHLIQQTRSQSASRTTIMRWRWRLSVGGEAEESSDLEQHLGEGLSPASCTERNAAQRPLVPVTPTTGTTIQTSDLRFAILQLQPERVPEEVRKRARGDRGARVPCCVRERACSCHFARVGIARTGIFTQGLSESLDRCGAFLNPRCNASKIKKGVFCYNSKRC